MYEEGDDQMSPHEAAAEEAEKNTKEITQAWRAFYEKSKEIDKDGVKGPEEMLGAYGSGGEVDPTIDENEQHYLDSDEADDMKRAKTVAAEEAALRDLNKGHSPKPYDPD